MLCTKAISDAFETHPTLAAPDKGRQNCFIEYFVRSSPLELPLALKAVCRGRQPTSWSTFGGLREQRLMKENIVSKMGALLDLEETEMIVSKGGRPRCIVRFVV